MTFKSDQEIIEYLQKTLSTCHTSFEKTKAGSSQHSLLVNRMKALNLAIEVLQTDDIMTLSQAYSQKEILFLLKPLASIKSKSITGQAKCQVGTGSYTRFQKLIDAMDRSMDGVERLLAVYEREK